MRIAVVCLVLAGLAPPLLAGEPNSSSTRIHQVPYRLTSTNHVLVRVKINGKGPYHFIVDTGAPTLFVSTAVCRKLGIESDKQGWGTFDRFAIEGGVVLNKVRGRVEDPFQLEGMNGLGLAGTELHGIIGYSVLARFRLEFDFTKDKMGWTPLDFEPPAPEDIMARAYLIIAGLMWVAYGIYLLVMPQALAGTAGVTATTVTGVIELRAMYGGLEMAVGAFALAAALPPGMLTSGLLAMGLACAGLGLTRLCSAAAAGEFSTYTRQGLGLELTLTVLALWLLLRQTRTVPRRT